MTTGNNAMTFTDELRRAKLFDRDIMSNAQETVDFVTNILESFTKYSIIGKEMEGKILLPFERSGQ